jgi:hypothetical protein
VARHIFQACPVWIYTQSNITSIKSLLMFQIIILQQYCNKVETFLLVLHPFVTFLALSLSLSANNFDRSFSSNEGNLLWAILFILFSRAFRFEFLAAPALGHDRVQFFFYASSIQKTCIIGRWARQQLKLRNKYRILRIIRCSLTNQEREYILNV